MKPTTRLFAALVVTVPALLAGPAPEFAEHTIARGLRGGYQVVVADLNRDGRPDLIALASGMPELAWFENPGWQRHVVAANLPHLINCAVFEAGGRWQMVVASGFANEAKNSTGNVWALEAGADVRQLWKIREIDRLPTSHRLRVAHFGGPDQVFIVNVPLTAPTAFGPDYRGHTPLVYYRAGEWKRTLITNANEGVMHGICVADWDHDGRDDLLTASFVGIHLHQLQPDGRWRRTEIAKGNPAPWPKSGASDVAVGQLGGRRFVCSIEPWHGNEVVVYREAAGAWQRDVIDNTFVDGHTIATADLQGNGHDAIIAGHRGAGGGLYYYLPADAAGSRWERHAIDVKQIATASCALVDLNGDGKLDLVAIGSATANLKWYEQR